ncbi:hypothetical protein JCM10908_006593 [Rhodotorula pacifica]|uniref:uncharacterized protein n=1 Tax=Rhodotorula pacifica TaxID=1495444 RepID=UPI003178AE27
MPFFQPPLRLDEYQRASSASPVASTSAVRLSDSPSPNKKRRVDSVPPSLAEFQRLQSSTGSRSASHSPAPRSQAASRKSVTDAARRTEINARYAELTRDEARLQATLRLQDAWEDIQRRHSKLAGSGAASDASQARSSRCSTEAEKTKKKRYRHRPGRTRALPVEEDDIIDLSTLDFVQDRGVLRSSKAGGFAIGRFGNGREGDILVGLDTGGGEGASGSGDGDVNGPDEEEEDDEDEDEDEWADYTDSDASTYSSSDELGEDDDLLPPPSLLFREQRRKEAERLKEMRDFQEQEAKARGELARAQEEEVVVLRGGNVQLPAPIGPPQSAPRRRVLPRSLDNDDDDDDLALSPSRQHSIAPTQRTPTRAAKAASQPPSSTAALRRSVSDIRLDSPSSSSSRTTPRRASTVKPAPVKRGTSVVAAVPPARETRTANGIRSPPASFSNGGSVPLTRRSSLSRPPVSSSPLREVITIASPTPPPPPTPTHSRRVRRRSPSPELFAPPEPTKARIPRCSPELMVPAPVPCQQATPTPTPPPARPPARKEPPPPLPSTTTKPRAVSVKPSNKPKRHSFELIIDVKPVRMTPPPAASPMTAKRRPAPPKKALASSASMPNLPVASPAKPALPPPSPLALVETAANVAPQQYEEEKNETQAPRRVGGLNTPPLSKRSTASRRSPSQSPAKIRAASAVPSPRQRVTATPSVILPVPPRMPSVPSARRMVIEDDSDEDELMLSSPTKPTPQRYSSARLSMTPAPPRRRTSLPESRARSQSVSAPAASTSTWNARRAGRTVPLSDESSEDELGRIVTVASPAVELTPQHAAWLLELVVSISTTCHGLAIISYLLSPAHFVVLAYRIVLQVQFTLPRRVHANRSLRFFLALWGVQSVVAIVLHAATGSQGTKGPRGYVQRGIVLDFVGQAYTPSTLHLIALDVLLAALQLVTIVLAFGATVPSDLDTSTNSESSRDYSSLLGIDEYEDTTLDLDALHGVGYLGGDAEYGSGYSRRRNGYSAVEGTEQDGDLFNMDDLGIGSSSKYTLTPDPALRLRVPIPLIASVRLGTIWREVRKSAAQDQSEREEGDLRGLEEGRGPS